MQREVEGVVVMKCKEGWMHAVNCDATEVEGVVVMKCKEGWMHAVNCDATGGGGGSCDEM
jgi:hypothetical protein